MLHCQNNEEECISVVKAQISKPKTTTTKLRHDVSSERNNIVLRQYTLVNQKCKLSQTMALCMICRQMRNIPYI